MPKGIKAIFRAKKSSKRTKIDFLGKEMPIIAVKYVQAAV